MGRFLTGLVIGALIGYYYGATHPDVDLKDKVTKGLPCKYEQKMPCIDEYCNDHMKKMKLQYKNVLSLNSSSNCKDYLRI